MAIPASIEFLFHDLGRLQINRSSRPAAFNAADTVLAANRLLSASGAAEIYYNSTTAAQDVQLPNPAECDGQTRVIGCYAGGNDLTVKQWNATNFAGAALATVFAPAGTVGTIDPVEPSIRVFYCDGSTWINIGVSYISTT